MDLIIDLKNNLAGGQSVKPISLTGNTNGSAIDLINTDMRTQVLIGLGALTDNAVFSVQIQESDTTTSGDFGTPTDATNTNSGNLTANTLTVLSFQRGKRYARAKVTLQSGGANAAGIMECILIGQKKYVGGAGYDRSPST